MARIDLSRQVSMVGSSPKMGQKAQYTPKGQKTLKTWIFHSHPCGFYIKNIAFPIEMAS